MKKIIFAAISALIFGIACTPHSEQIRFGVDPSYPPFESRAPNGELIGFDIDIGNAICEKLKVKCVWQEGQFDGFIPALKARKIDAILSSLGITDKREEQIAFSDKILNAPVRMIAKKGSDLLPTVDSLKGKIVGVQQGTTQEDYAKKYWSPARIQVRSYQDQNQVYTDLLSGRLDVVLQDEIQGSLGFLKTEQGQNFAFAGPRIVDSDTLGRGNAIGLRKEDTELKNKINQALKEIHEDGTYDKLQKKYFDFDVYNL